MSKHKIISVVFFGISIITIATGLGNLFIAFDKINDLYSNQYVGGDAYNLIINAQYFTGHAVLSIGSFIISSIFLIAAFCFLFKKEAYAQPSRTDNSLPVL